MQFSMTLSDPDFKPRRNTTLNISVSIPDRHRKTRGI